MCHVFMLGIGLTLNMASIIYTHQLLLSTSQCKCTCLGVHWIYTLFSSSTFKQLLVGLLQVKLQAVVSERH